MKLQLLDRAAYEALESRLGCAPRDSSLAFYVVDPLGRIRWCSDTFAAMVGVAQSEILGQLSVLFYQAECAPLFLRRRVTALLGWPVDPEVTVILRARSGRKPVILRVTSLQGEGQNILGRLALVREASASVASDSPS